MKILLAHNFYRSTAPSGEDSAYGDEKRLLERHFRVVTFERHNDQIDDSSLARRVSLALNGAWSRRTYAELSALIERERPDLAHFHNTFPLITPSAYAACRDAGVPVVQTLHNFRQLCPQAMLLRDGAPCELCLDGSGLHALRHRCYRNSYSATLAQLWTRLYNRRAGSYRCLVNRYIALTRFAAEKFVRAGYGRRMLAVLSNTLNDSPPAGAGEGGYALYVGRLSPEKGVRTLLAAWRRLRIPLRIAGEGPLRAEMEEEARAAGLGVTFLGHLRRDEVLGQIRGALLQVVPSECYEGFPMVLLEAMACATPVVASRIGSLDEIVVEGVTGVKFPAASAAGLARAVTGLLEDRKRLAALRARARMMYEREYSREEHVARLRSLYAAVLRENGRGAPL